MEKNRTGDVIQLNTMKWYHEMGFVLLGYIVAFSSVLYEIIGFTTDGLLHVSDGAGLDLCFLK
jgi:hypothetical protein